MNEKNLKTQLDIISEEIISLKHSVLLEMATFGRINADNQLYRIAIHGPASGDRPMPHIHIYLANDHAPYTNFNFEVSLVDLVCYDKIVLVAQTDRSKNIRRTNKNECTWSGYKDLYNEFRKFLFSKPMKKLYKNIAQNNLQVAIMEWDNENNDNMDDNQSLMKTFIESKGFNILPSYLPFFEYDNNDKDLL